MTHRFASRFRTLLPLAVALSLITSIFSFAPSAMAATTIASVSPSSGTTAGGTTLTITGTDYLVPGFKVSFDGVDNFSYTNRTNTSFNLVTPPHAAGTVVIRVHTDVGDPTANYTYVIYNTYFLPNGGTPAMAPLQYSPVPTNLNDNIFTKAGYTFTGWNTVADGSGTPYVNLAFCCFVSYLVLYAQWTPVVTTYTVHYSNIGSTSGSAPSDNTQYLSGATVTVKDQSTLLKTGYSFGGWTDHTTTYPYPSTFIIMHTTDLDPIWTPISTAHTVTFKSNYSGGPADTTQTASTTTNLTANGFTRTGYTFNNWNTDPAGGGMGLHFLNSASYSFATDLTLYAQWTANGSYTITYLGNTNTGGLAPSPTVGSGSVTLATNSGVLAKTGSTFGGWNTAANGTGTSYAVGSTYNLIADITLYAQWTAIGSTFTITYVGNGNTGGAAPTPTTGSGLVTLATNSGVFVKTGSTFAGWNTTASGSGISYTVGGSYNLIADVTLYAVWTPSGTSTTFKVTYVGNGATGGNTPVDATLYESGALVTVRPLGTLVRTGYAFVGWDNGGSTVFQPNQTFNITSNVTLTALWTAGKYAVTYDGNGNTGGTVPADSTLYSSGAVVTTLSPGSLVKSGSTFGGWTKEGSATVLAPARIFIISSNTTLTAVWTASAIYTITYSGNGNTGGTVPTSATGSGTQTLATNSGGLVKTGYTFVGWNTYANGLGTLRAAGSTYLLSANVTLYAIYAPTVAPKNAPSLILKGKIVVTAPPKKIALNQIVPVHQQFVTKLPANVVGFELYQNGKLAIKGKTNSVPLKQIVGPKDQVTVIAVGKNGLKSRPAPVAVSKDPISLANINFNTDSYKFIGIATKILDKVAAVMIQHGYTHLDIWGYVDTQGSKASWITLSNNRAKAVNNYMSIKLKGKGITIKNAGRAQTQAVGNNNTAAGRALNRRVEIRVS